MDLIEAFLISLASEKNLSINSQGAYRRDLDDFVSSAHATPLLCVADDIKLYLKGLRHRGFAPATIARKLSTLRSFFKYMVLERLRSDNPMNLVFSPKRGFAVPKALTRSEIAKILAVIENEKDFVCAQLNVMINLLYTTGMRVSELVNLTMQQLPINLAHEFKESHFILKGKGGRERVVLFSERALELLSNYLKIRAIKYGNDNPWLFPYGKTGSKPMSRFTFYMKLSSIAKSCGICRVHVSPHKLRHSFATHMLEGGADLRVIQELLGHTSINTTQIYTNIVDSKIKDAVLNKHPLAQLRRV
jgi:integrase/recombinase XerD